ncbi:TadE/TadG family type IV pilus assembly protein [Phytoactinopolyspora alkaliphila]|uniref:TadE/TadG family type IV pilus assembly protein n=1 Tax=Phytoactinopolyspora alkaliphila TaxID=1783498 RepID=UPI001C2092AC
MTGRLVRALPRLRDDRGSAALEWAICVPVAILLISALALAGYVALAAGSVEQAANDAARAASLARTPTAAVSDAKAAAAMSLADQGIECLSTTVDVDTSGFHSPPGQHATVEVTIACPIRVAHLGIPGITSRTATFTGVSPVDTYRQR